MQTDIWAITTILGMAFVTYLTRAGGLFIVSRLNMSKPIRAFLQAIPGAVLISIVLPALFNGGIVEAIAGAITMLTAIISKNLLLSLGIGILSVCILRAVSGA